METLWYIVCTITVIDVVCIGYYFYNRGVDMDEKKCVSKERKAAEDKLAVSLKKYFQTYMSYRLYADGSVVFKDDWDDLPEDGSDDYMTYDVPFEIVEYIQLEAC